MVAEAIHTRFALGARSGYFGMCPHFFGRSGRRGPCIHPFLPSIEDPLLSILPETRTGRSYLNKSDETDADPHLHFAYDPLTELNIVLTAG